MDTPIFIYDPEEWGNFQPDDVNDDECAYVLTRGPRQGHCCKKISSFSTITGGGVKACTTHLPKFESMYMELYDRVVFNVLVDELAWCTNTPSFDIDKIPKKIAEVHECCVCLMEENLARLPCEHVVCTSCFKQLGNTLCPLCRDDFSNSQKYIRRI